MGRSLRAILIGFLVFALEALAFFEVSGHAPADAPTAAFATVSVLAGIAAGYAAGWVTARMAPRDPITHTALLALLTALAMVVSFFFTPGTHWTQILAMFVFAPVMMAAGFAAAPRVS